MISHQTPPFSRSPPLNLRPALHWEGDLGQSMALMFLTGNNPPDGTFIARQFVNTIFLGQFGFFNMWFSLLFERGVSVDRTNSRVQPALLQAGQACGTGTTRTGMSHGHLHFYFSLKPPPPPHSRGAKASFGGRPARSKSAWRSTPRL